MRSARRWPRLGTWAAREYEAIAQSGDEPTVDAVIEVLSQGAIALPSFASAGPYAGRPGRLEGVESLRRHTAGRARDCLLALMTAVLIESLGAAGEIFVDGPLARNPLFARLLAACVPVGTVRTYPEGGGTRVAAHLAGLPLAGAGRLASAVPLRLLGPARIPGELAPPPARNEASDRASVEEPYDSSEPYALAVTSIEREHGYPATSQDATTCRIAGALPSRRLPSRCPRVAGGARHGARNSRPIPSPAPRAFDSPARLGRAGVASARN